MDQPARAPSSPGARKKRLGVVIPTYNERESIAPLVRDILANDPDAALVVVDDSPDDETVRAVEALGLPNVRMVHRNGKGGRGSAVIEGLRLLLADGCDLFLEMDADFSHPPEQIPALRQKVECRDLDLLIASRYLPSSRILNWPISRRVFSRASNRLASAVLRVPVSDYTNGFRLYSRRAAELIVETCGSRGKGFIALSEILVNLYYRGFNVSEVPTTFTNRVRGESSLSVTEVKNALVGLFKIAALARSLRRSNHV